MGRDDASVRFLIGTLLLVSTLAIMVSTVVSPVLPAIRADFTGIENVDLLVRLLLTLPSIFVALGAPVVGLLADRVGRKPVLLASTALYGLAGGAGYLLETLPALLVSRALLGLATAGVFVTATTLIADYFQEERRRDTVLGWQGASITFSGVVFLSVGGVLAEVDWRTPFLLYAGALLLVPLVAVGLYEPEGTATRTSTLAAPKSLRGLVRRLSLRTLALIYGIGLLGNVVFFMVPVEIPFYLESLTNASGTQIGLAVAVSTLFSGIAALQFGRIRRRLGIRSLVALLFGLLGIGFGLIGSSTTYSGVIVSLAVAGFGFGLLPPMLNSWIATDIPGDVRGRAFGGLTSAFFLGQFLSPLASTPVAVRIGLSGAFDIGAVVLITTGVVFVLLIPPDVDERDVSRVPTHVPETPENEAITDGEGK